MPSPSVVSVTSPDADQIYRAGDTIRIAVGFDTAVTVDTTDGIPSLQLSSGITATYISGSGASVLTFTFVVANGQNAADLDYASTTALKLNDASIKDAGGIHEDATLTLPAPGAAGSLGANKDIVIDTVVPILAITSAAAATLKIGETSTITFTFSEAPIGFNSGAVLVSGGTLSGLSATANPLIYTATFTPTAGENNGSASISVDPGSYSDTAGNAGLGSAKTILFDTRAPSAPATPTLEASSDSGTLNNDRITNVLRPTFGGAAGSVEALATVHLYGPDGLTEIGHTTAAADGSWSATMTVDTSEGTLTVIAKATDQAGNTGAASSALSVTIDRTPPAAPAAPTLALASDTGTVGDGRTTNASPVIQGTAAANAPVVLYDGLTQIGTATADAGGLWQITVPLAVGSHTLAATQSDAAGNFSAAGGVFTLLIESPPSPPSDPTTLIDGMAVQTGTAALPGGVVGTTISIPVVGAGRTDSGGTSNVADIALASSGGATQLLAQLPVGYGLYASGATVTPTAGRDFLTATIKAATPAMGAAEQLELLGSGQSFLSQAGSLDSLLVMTVAPTSVLPTGTLTLSGTGAPAGQGVAVVVDARGLSADGKLDLLDVDFVAVVGKADVSVRGGGTVLSGDGAAQHFTVAAGRGDIVFAGGGNDLISVDLSSSATGAKAKTVVYGGQGNDVVGFSGNRADYLVDQHNGYVLVTSKADPALVSQIVNAEQLQFGDAVVEVSSKSSLSTLAGLYQAVLGRQADVGGMEFWANGRDTGASWGSIAVNFINSSERLAANTGFTGNAEHDVTLLFNALFHRAPDTEGLAFWRKALENGATLEQVATGFVESPEMVGLQIAPTDWNFRA